MQKADDQYDHDSDTDDEGPLFEKRLALLEQAITNLRDSGVLL